MSDKYQVNIRTGERYLVFELGDKVRMSGTVYKDRIDDKTTYVDSPYVPYRIGTGTYSNPEKRFETGIIVGKRTMREGITHSSLGEEPAWFEPTTSFPIYLVAYNLHHKFVMCRPEQLEKIED